MSKKIAVILSGCGHQDGAEITESVSTLISLSEAGVWFQIFAPDFKNVLSEAARIARGNIRPLSELKAKDFDGLALPGGFGVVLNLCNWSTEGAKCQVLPDAERVIKEFYTEQKPIAAICIAPALVARVLGKNGITLTVGNDPTTASEIAKTGALHESCPVDDFISDRGHKIISTPAYMYAEARPFEVFSGVRKAIREMVEMA
jgi:enhancing lycopene biosynthesis protein 2